MGNGPFYGSGSIGPAAKGAEWMDFTGQIHRICEPYYKAGGRRPIDPAVVLKPV